MQNDETNAGAHVSRDCRSRSFRISHFAFCILLAATGCGPNTANIALRKENQSLKQQVADRDTQIAQLNGQVQALTENRTIQELPADRMARLYKTSRISFKRLTGGDDLDPKKPGDEGFRVSITPVDQFGDEFKAAGSIKVELFDLAAAEPRLGEWDLSTADALPKWLSTPVFDAYLLSFPWKTVPTHSKLSVKVTFTEELTGARFDATQEINVQLPPATQPSS